MAPNVFTPNGDDTHDVLQIIGMDTRPELLVSIYNRWGNLVYETTDYYNNQWNGENAPDGVYYLVVSNNDNEPIYSGTIHVMR